MLGEQLYPMIQKVQPKLAGKITGMLLDSGWGIPELLSLVHDEEKLATKIAEAVAVLARATKSQNQPENEEETPQEDSANQ